MALPLFACSVAESATGSSRNNQEKETMTDESDTSAAMETAVDALYAAYAETDVTLRKALLERAVTDDVEHWTRQGLSHGRESLSAAIDDFLDVHNGNAQKREGEIQALRNIARTAWSVIGRKRLNLIRGEAYFELAEDSRLNQVVNFSDPPHEVVVNDGAKAYIDAWNSDTLEQRLAALNEYWARDARWVELRFDHGSVEAIANHMRPVINLTALDGVMDVMYFDDAGIQIRLQVEVKKRDGDLIGIFTDFIAVDDDGKVTRLGGFKGESLTLSHKLGNVHPDWNWSYRSGYADANGVFAGGSEIMHLESHDGKLYGLAGYWEDNHWVVPDGRAKQSAQLLRLDSSDGAWRVDLDLGTASPPGINIMKGNILKEITFTMDCDGNTLSEPATLLFMAAGNISSQVNVWVLDDDSGEWMHEVVASGEPIKNMRYVPRDVEIFTDKVTGQERIFLLLGNPGIISGVYDSSQPTKIRWDSEIEFPKGEMLKVRPLGMVEANGELYFSGGGSIYKRHDGPDPTYTEILNLADLPNVEMGGVRGLSAVDNPNGEGESLIFMWAPDKTSIGAITRLDPDGSGGFSAHEETRIGDLMEGVLGNDVEAIKVLGAYNNFYKIEDPKTGKEAHLIGFQAVLRGNDSLVSLGGYYGGGMYALRTADMQYKIGEINGRFRPGNAGSVAPRTFALSPFGDDRLFAAGYDSNFAEATGMAWAFDASLDVFLEPLRD